MKFGGGGGGGGGVRARIPEIAFAAFWEHIV
jgi:hypothetical protein